MTNPALALAKSIADKPSAFSIDQLRDAIVHLRRNENSGTGRTRAAWDRLERRIKAIETELQSRRVA